MTTDNTTTKTVPAMVYLTENDTVRVAIPRALHDAPADREFSPGIKLCGWHRGKKWGVVKMYNTWLLRDGTCVGEIYTAYRLDLESDREAFDWICSNGDAKSNEF